MLSAPLWVLSEPEFSLGSTCFALLSSFLLQALLRITQGDCGTLCVSVSWLKGSQGVLKGTQWALKGIHAKWPARTH